MVAIWYEVFPVTLVAQQPVLVRRTQELKRGPWLLRSQDKNHPNDVVLAHILNFFGDACDLGRTIVHSTSWRYEQEQLLLTYLAVLPQRAWSVYRQEQGCRALELEAIGTQEKCFGDHLLPPPRVAYQSVLAHALDHLASLTTYDAAIQAALEPEWNDVLAARLPKSAGYLRETLLV